MLAGVRWSTPEEQRSWMKSVDADLAREPPWGGLITRTFARKLGFFAEWKSEAR